MANVFPWLEVLAGGLLLVGLWTHIAVLLGLGLLPMFSGAVAASLWRGKRQECGCFSSLTPVQWRLVYRNLGLMGFLLPVCAFRGGSWAMDSWLMGQAGCPLWFSTGSRALIGVWLISLSATLCDLGGETSFLKWTL